MIHKKRTKKKIRKIAIKKNKRSGFAVPPDIINIYSLLFQQVTPVLSDMLAALKTGSSIPSSF